MSGGRPIGRRAFLGAAAAGTALLACGAKRAYACPDPAPPTSDELASYTWLTSGQSIRSLRKAIVAPDGYARDYNEPGSFAAWLRYLPLRAPNTPVKSYDGTVLHEGNDARIAAVAEIDCGTADLQQCADSAIRMNAEWLWSKGDKAGLGYHFLSGDLSLYTRYAKGERAVIKGNKVTWAATAKPDDSRPTFRAWLDLVFNYASTISLKRESLAIAKTDLAPGDFFIASGSPGHCVLILDVAQNASGERAALLGQGYMPAQDFQVLASSEAKLGPWFSLEGESVDTPFWPAFDWSALHRFQRPSGT